MNRFDDDEPVLRAVLTGLQMAGIALALLCISEMTWQDAGSVPYKMCVLAAPKQEQPQP